MPFSFLQYQNYSNNFQLFVGLNDLNFPKYKPRPHLPIPSERRPILVLGGDRDVLVPSAALYETATYFGADLDVMDGAPHGLMLDTVWWRITADRILAWLTAQGF